MKTPSATSPVDHQLRRARRQLEDALRAGSDVRAESLLAECPAVAADPHAALELVYTEFALREQLGQNPATDDWYARFPHWRDDLRQMFEVHEELRKESVRRASRASTTLLPVLPDTGVGQRRIGEFELQGEIGRGGMGVVYKAKQPSLGRTVAVKVILSGAHAGQRERERFRHEVETAARLDHANIVRIFEVGEEDGRPYCAMEFVDGASLAEVFAGTPWPPRLAAELVATVASAADHAHRNGVVHRDLKPANILLAGTKRAVPRPDDTPPASTPASTSLPSAVKIVDFGLAKSLSLDGSEAGSAPGPTRSGDIVGTPAYMAPEQADRSVAPVGPPTDVWALGATLYELLVGHPPFQGETSLETLEQVKSAEPVSPRRLRPGIPRDLEVVCLKCLRKRPEDRYATAAELADDLGRWLRDESIHARPVGAISHAARWCRRHPRESVLLALLALLLVGGPILFAVLWLDARAARSAEAGASRDKDTALAEKDAAIERLEHLRYGAQVAEARLELEVGGVENARHLLDGTPPRFRHFEWDYLHRLSGHAIQRRPFASACWVAIHPDLRSVAWVESTPQSPTGEPPDDAAPVRRDMLAVGKHRVQIREHPSGRLLQSWAFEGGLVHSVGYADRGRLLVVSGLEPALRIWEAATGKLVHEVPSVGERVYFSPCAETDCPAYLVSYSATGGPIRFWDGRTGKELPACGVPKGEAARTLVLSPDQQTFAVTTRNLTTNTSRGYIGRVGDATLGTPVAARSYSNFGIEAFDDTGRFATGRTGADNTLLVVDLEEKKVLHRLRVDGVLAGRSAFDRQRAMVAASLADGGVAVWQITDQQDFGQAKADRILHPLPTPSRVGGRVSRLQFADDGALGLVSGLLGESVETYAAPSVGYRDLLPEAYPRTAVKPRALSLQCVWFHPDGRRLFVSGPCGFDVWDVDARRQLHADRLREADCLGLMPSPDGSRFLVARAESEFTRPGGTAVQVLEGWAAEPLRKLWEKRTEDRGLVTARFTPDSSAVVVVHRKGVMSTYDAITGETRTESRVEDAGDAVAAIPPLAGEVFWMRADAATGDTEVRVSDPATGRELRRQKISEKIGRDSVFLTGDRILSPSTDDRVLLWGGGAPAREYRGLAGAQRLAVTADEKRILALGAQHVSVWDSETAQRLLALPIPPFGSVSADLAVSPDGKWIAVVGHQGQVRLWTTK